MRTIYIDSDYKCHLINDDAMAAVDTDAFDGKCDTFVEGCRFVPEGETWTREDGEVFSGEMIAPWKDYNELDEAQRDYELQMLADYAATIADMESALNKLGVSLDETVD